MYHIFDVFLFFKGLYNAADDEANRREELKRRKQEEERREFSKTVHAVAADKEKVLDMRRQEELKTELQLAYKKGDTKTQAKIEKRLAPEVVRAVKHPWAG